MFFGLTKQLEEELEEKDHLIRKLNADMKRMKVLSRQKNEQLSKELDISNTRLENLDSRLNNLSMKEVESLNNEMYSETNNKRYFYDAAEVVLSLAKRDKVPLSLGAVYIDSFVMLNKEFSREKVDRVLQAIVHKLTTTIRESDIFVKFDDAKFILLFPETSLAQCKIVSDKLRKAVVSCKIVDNIDFTLSVAMTEYSMQEDNINTALQRVEKLLEEEKKRKNL